MKTSVLKDLGLYTFIVAGWTSCFYWIPALFGNLGFFGSWFETATVLKFSVIWVLTAHLTITCMSLCFHRSHTHQAVKLHPLVDYPMQWILWTVTSMSKLDWVSVHVYHHTHSDTSKDPHSPSQKGLLRVFFFGAFDYTRAKNWPEVQKIRARIPASPVERYIARHTFQAPIMGGILLMILFGPLYGSILTVLNFAISPLFAVGGVNALAHAIGYQNYDAKDESRNIGFLFPLNWIISGELDHNNHHKFPKSPSFAHRWFEFDIGWVYLKILSFMGLAKITGKVPKGKLDQAPANSQSEVAFVS
jgi:stearoyl-CoA desaturase (delta-9 desaturase)